MSVHWWINSKVRCSHVVEEHSPVGKDGFLDNTALWRKLRNTQNDKGQSRAAQSQSDECLGVRGTAQKWCCASLQCMRPRVQPPYRNNNKAPTTVKFAEQKRHHARPPRVGGWREWEVTVTGYGVSWRRDERLWSYIVGMDTQLCEHTRSQPVVHL